jgi:hypothetical protein
MVASPRLGNLIIPPQLTLLPNKTKGKCADIGRVAIYPASQFKI